jgi:hypothetical protein
VTANLKDSCTSLVGFPFVAIIVNIPQRSQAVNGFSPVKAGLALLPLLLSSPFATLVSGLLTSNFAVPPVYLIILGSILQAIGVGLTLLLPLSGGPFPRAQYGYEVIMGLGFGLTLATVLTLAQLVVDKKDVGVVMGALTQVRVLGGTVALAICSMLLSNSLQDALKVVITPQQLAGISDSLSAIDALQPSQIATVRTAFAEGYHRQMILLTAFSGVTVLACLLLWESQPRRVVKDS